MESRPLERLNSVQGFEYDNIIKWQLLLSLPLYWPSIKHQKKKKEENNSGMMEASESVSEGEPGYDGSPHTHLERLQSITEYY
jgi:hypothetical protein